MEATRHEYWLPTYGLEYPATEGGSKGALPSQLFRPVEYQSTQKLLSDIRAERSKGDGRRVLQQDKADSNEVPLKVLEVKASIQNKTLWKSFVKLGNEMIVTKPGRSVSRLQNAVNKSYVELFWMQLVSFVVFLLCLLPFLFSFLFSIFIFSSLNFPLVFFIFVMQNCQDQ